MLRVKPRVYLVGMTGLSAFGLSSYLESIGAKSWKEDRFSYIDMAERLQPAPELLTEVAGRICYRSWEPGLNLNVTKVRKSVKEYFKNLIKSGHGSVLEHVVLNFIFQDVSRVFTHELVRHRVGTAVSQESGRYVRTNEIHVRETPSLPDYVRERGERLVRDYEDFMRWAAIETDLENKPFDVKKMLTSDIRTFAPTGQTCDMMWSANIRTLRHVISMRTSMGAETEIRRVFDKVATIVSYIVPNLFQDFSIVDGEWVSDYE